jgi:uncharacterized protein
MSFFDVSLYLIIGAFAGFLAGLLGIGGGIVIVPILVFTFARHGFAPDVILLFSLGTSLASIIVTSMASVRAHHRKGTVDWWIVRAAGPWAALGTLGGALLAPAIPKLALSCFIGLSQLHVATLLLRQSFRKTPDPGSQSGARDSSDARESGRRLLKPVSTGIGLVSSWIGIGGGTLLVPFLTFLKLPIKRAISTSAALGFPISVAGAAGFLLGGGQRSFSQLPDFSVGFVYLPAFLGIAIGSLLTVALGAHTAHRIDARLLRRIFAVFLYGVALKMLFSIAQ